MKDIWRKRYSRIAENPGLNSFDVLTGFNANIDCTVELEELDWSLDVDGEKVETIKDLEDVKKVVKFAVENGRNVEVDGSKLQHNFNGVKTVGGQAGIMANFLSGLEGSVTFYTPFLSGELSEMINENVLHPCFENRFVLKNVRDASNTDRTKENIIIEFSEPQTGRVILSDNLRGFGPYFRSGVEENLDLIDENIQGALFSGFQNVDGNKRPKLEKSRQQLEKIESRKHLELADCEKESLKLIGSEILDCVDSIGMDENEALQLSNLIGEDLSNELDIVEAFKLSKKLLEDTELSRCHLHTRRYHLLVIEKKHAVDLEDMLHGMLFGEIAAVKTADLGRLPKLEDFDGLEFEQMHVKRLDSLEKLGNHLEAEEFASKGTTSLDEFNVAAIPTVIHEAPKRLVGMGDLISSGSFVYELSRET